MYKKTLAQKAGLLCLQLVLAAYISSCSKGPDKKAPAPSGSGQTQNPQTPDQPQPEPPKPQPQPEPPKPQPQPEPPKPQPLPEPPKPQPQPPKPQPEPPKPQPQPPKPQPQPPKPQPQPPKPQPEPPKPQPKPEPLPPNLPPVDPSVGVPAWGGSSDRQVWTKTVRAVAFGRLKDLEKAGDKEVFCPGYSEATLNQRLNCWVEIVAAISKFESNFKTGDSFREPDGNDSIGLLALSPGECPNAHSAKELGAPVPNLVCGTNIMANLIGKYGWIDAAPGVKPEDRAGHGAAQYWSTLRPPYKRWDPTRDRYLSLGYKNQILPLTRSYRGSSDAEKKGPDKGKIVRGGSPLKKAMDVVTGDLVSCSAVERLATDEAGREQLQPVDFSVSLRSSDEVPSGVVAEFRSGGTVRMVNDAQVVTISADDAGQAIDAARAAYPDRDFSGVKSVRMGSAGKVTVYELLGASGASVAKVLTSGWKVARCGR